ncbi:ABC transporter ATP-binding protein [Roseinatronobacter sp. S2]|uniref:ABC transporter ATP-binding protein n=1 Tax=Roseinatronobacter sp. S2 TaxID=3035471 RepID=UPI00240ED283|nr:sn-glycerol-3-phosphate ABC transporter ATP-binding protein UgpC [Roseinatronobacter sp. S2]WFE76843.1 sn-glycerol-3-phosphate ABC transporter ATP-binding protein UgpC [Roseinatronobacter sp. S2]
MTHSISIKDLTLSFGAVTVLEDLNLDVGQGEFLVLLGSSGCGKSTLLNCIAGLLDVTDGEIHIQGKNVTWEEPSKRGIGMVFQSYALYPQMTVEGNLAFGLKNARVPKAEIATRIARAADVLQIEPLLKRKPAALSGGQRQRVAIGRALVRDVDVFLFDEPLSNLDAKLRANLRVEIKRLHHTLKNTMIYVTHDQVEAMTLADRIAIMRDGQIMQLAPPAEIYNRPVNKYVAGFIGSPAMNLIPGQLDAADQQFDTGLGMAISVQGYEFTSAPITGPVWLGLRPEHVLSGQMAQTQPVQLDAYVDMVEPMGSDTQVWAKIGKQELRFRMDGQAEVAIGDTVPIGFDPARLSLFDKKSEARL